MRTDKKEAFELRKQGKTFNEISKSLGISKGTLSFWFKGIDWSREISEKNFVFNYSPENIKKMHIARRHMLDKKYLLARQEALNEFDKYKEETQFVAGIVAYSGEGDHSVKNGMARIANSNPGIILIFKRFLEKYYFEMYKKIRVSILLYPDLNDEECLKYWSETLGVSIKQFHKPVHIIGKHKKRRLRYGVGSLIISNKFFKIKLLELENLCLQHLARI